MKQCPTCRRTYTDDSLSFCLEDGGLLATTYEPPPTQRIDPARVTGPSGTQPYPAFAQTAPRTRKRWPIFLALGVFAFAMVMVGIAILILFYSKSVATSSVQVQGSANQNSTNNQNTSSNWDQPAASPTIESRQMVGTWRTNVNEDNQNTEITYTFNPDGRSTMLFRYSDGTTAKDSGTWQYSDGVLFEKFANGASGRGSIRWIDDDHFEITIIDNGVPAYAGLKRRYRRV